MGGAPYMGLRWGGGRYYRVSVSQLHVDVKEHPGKLLPVATATIDFSLIQARLPIKSEGGWLSGRYVTVPLTAAVLSHVWL
jgi:hypothetical protein